MPLSAGEKLGSYEILSFGAGGMGKISNAQDTRLDRTATVEVSGIDRKKTTQPNESGWVEESLIYRTLMETVLAVWPSTLRTICTTPLPRSDAGICRLT